MADGDDKAGRTKRGNKDLRQLEARRLQQRLTALENQLAANEAFAVQLHDEVAQIQKENRDIKEEMALIRQLLAPPEGEPS